MDKFLFNIHKEQKELYEVKNTFSTDKKSASTFLNDVKRVIKKNPHLKRINNEIAKLHLVTFKKIGNKMDYIIDALNVERGFINNFKNINKILSESKNQLKHRKILVIVRACMGKQSKKDNKACMKLIQQHKNVKIIYIHTNYKKTRLIESCRTSRYCNPQEAASGVSTRGERLCITPIITASGNIRPTHDVCEIDDLLTFYFALRYNAKIISNTEDYSKTMNESKVKSMKYFLNIPISYYEHTKSKTTKKELYIDPFKLVNPFLTLFHGRRFTPDRSVILHQRSPF